MMSDGDIGRVTGVHGFRVKVELGDDVKSPVRADLDGCYTAVAINSYLTFPIGAGEVALGIVTDLDAWEAFDPTREDATLELVRPRRLATVQLLGTVRQIGKKPHRFDPGISILPTLDTPTQLAKREVLRSVFVEPPKCNRPTDHDGIDFDVGLRLGNAIGVPGQHVLGSFNDLLSRPMAVVGNTGSGKSCSVCHVVQEACRSRPAKRARIFVLDINGEYAAAFRKPDPEGGRRPNAVYVNGREFGIPVWLMSAFEVCEWLSASEQAQQPTLVNLWSIAKGATEDKADESNRSLRGAIDRLDQLRRICDGSGPFKGRNALATMQAFKGFTAGLNLSREDRRLAAVLDGQLKRHEEQYSSLGTDEAEILREVDALRESLSGQLADDLPLSQQSADKPIRFPLRVLLDPAALFEAAGVEDGDNSMRQFLRGLQLRLGNRLQDKRWSAFFNYEHLDIANIETWLNMIGIGRDGTDGDDICVIDCSMLGHEVLPYVCGIIGRILLEVREHAAAERRYHEPWVIVLEEAHNYVKPRLQDEDRGVRISRTTFERIAKEGRKFGLSLIVSSQRPRDISPTILSQCANFVIHRLQNPDDIEHFRSIVPSQSRRLMDQVTILSAGEAIVLGSAFHIPSRVQVQMPAQSPSSQSSAPHLSWQPERALPEFDLSSALTAWGVASEAAPNMHETMQKRPPPKPATLPSTAPKPK